MAKEIYEKIFSELKDEEIYSVVKQWFDGIQPMRGYPSFLVIIISLAVFAIFMYYFGIIIAFIIAPILTFAFGYRKVKPKIMKEEPPKYIEFTAITMKYTYPTKMKVSINDSLVRIEFMLGGGRTTQRIKSGWDFLSSKLWELLEHRA